MSSSLVRCYCGLKSSTDVLTVCFLNVPITETNKPNPQYPKRIMKEMAKERLAEAKSTGPKLCVDLSMTDSMSDKVGDCFSTLHKTSG